MPDACPLIGAGSLDQTRPLQRRRACRIARGTTLVELMVAIVIGMLVLGALASLFSHSSHARNEIDRAGQQVENGRFALELLRDDIHLAGHYGGVVGGAQLRVGACIPRSGLPLSASALGWQSDPPVLPAPIHGYASGDTPPAESCLSSQQPNTDVLVVRSVESVATTPGAVNGSALVNDYFIQVSSCSDRTIDPVDQPFAVAPGGPGAAARFPLHLKDCAAIAPLRKLVVHAWYVGRCSVCGGAGDGIPSLRLVELTGANASSVSVVEGIESMRIEYLLDTDGNGEIDTIRRCKAGVDPCTAADWSNIIAVQIRLLSRTLTPSPGHRDTKTYNMGLAGVIAAPNDAFKRHLFGAVVTAYNIAGPREK